MASASEGTGSSGDSRIFTDDPQRPLEEFLHTNTLPQTVSVAGGSFMSRDAMIVQGDVLLLRNKTPTSVTLSFDDDTGTTQELAVNPDISVHFLVLPPKDTILGDDASTRTGRPTSMVTYPTVADLLLDCPTYFETNSTYDDPYLPGFSVKPGDRFYFVKVVRDVGGDKTERLQCRTESGELVCLSVRCKGNFTVLSDEAPYTLRQLIDLAKVPRRLRLAPQNDTDNVNMKKNTGAEILCKLRACTGVITMSRPQEMLEVSPWDNLNTTWCIPIDCGLNVRLFSSTDYEEPVMNRKMIPEPISFFVQQHGQELPVQATILSYITPPDAIAQNLSSSREIIVHEKLRTKKLFVKDSKKDDFFAIDESVDISFLQIPRNVSSIFEMMALPLGSQVQVLADVAADFPEPFILRYGDVLCVTKHDSSSWKFKHSSTGDVPIVKCERLVQGKRPERLKLPLDLEISLVVIQDPSKLKVSKLIDIISGRERIPGGNVSVLEGSGASFPPLPASLQILEVLTDIELLVSPLSSTTAISPLIPTAVRIPVRHKAVLGFKRKLEFPDGYFVLPPKHDTVCLGIEHVEENEYEELVQARKVATEYEDVMIGPPRTVDDDARSQGSSTGRSGHSVNHETLLPRSSSSGTLERWRRKDWIKRLSRAITNPKNRVRQKESSNEPEESSVPVSGIMTLSLEPSHAVANDYITQDSPPQARAKDRGHQAACQGGESEYPEDTVYEDVDAFGGHTTHPVASATCSDTARFDRETSEESFENNGSDDLSENGRAKRHRRRKSDPGLAKMLVQVIQATDGLTRRRRRSPERHRNDESLSDELERAPKTHHTRTRSPHLPESADGNRSSKTSRRSLSADRTRAAHSSKHSSTEDQLKKRSDDVSRTAKRLKSRNYKTSEFEKSTEPGSPDLVQPREVRSSDLDKHRADRNLTSKQTSPESDKPRKPIPPDQWRKPRSPDLDTNQTSKQISPNSDKPKRPRPPEQWRKPRLPDQDGLTTDSRSRHACESLLSEKTSSDFNSPQSQENLQSPDWQLERGEVKGKMEGKKSPPRDTLVIDTTSGRQRSPRAEKRHLQQMQNSSGSSSQSAEDCMYAVVSKATSKKPESLSGGKEVCSSRSQASSGETESPKSEDGSQRPRRPHRKIDSGDDRLNQYLDSTGGGDRTQKAASDRGDDRLNQYLDSTGGGGSTPKAAPRVKPALPPKPVLSPKSERTSEVSDTCETLRNPQQPVAPPRKRAARIRSIEADDVGGGSLPPSKPVLDRKRLL